tara:strand:- start:172 stop:1572 length:1401 start_codon:yes stop_codon:yes gene_type:complete
MFKKNNYLIFLCVLLGGLKLISVSTTGFSLYGDEAQYWLWSKDLDFGYYSKPPLLSWTIWLFTSVFGDSFFALKSIPVFLYFFTSFLIYFFTQKLFNDRSLAVACSITFFLLPAASLSSFLLSTDSLLIFFWILSLIQVLQIKQNPNYTNFVILGILVGLTILTKYAGIYFIISIFLLFIIEKNYRLVFIKSKNKIFVSIICLFVVLLPNIIWNFQNDWLTLDHTAKNASLNTIRLNFAGLSNFIISQVIMIGPILFVGFVFYFFKTKKITNEEKFLISFALPALIIVLIESFLVRAHANWAAVSLVTLTIFFVGVLYKYNKMVFYISSYFNFLIGVALFVMIATTSSFSFFDRISGMKDFVSFLETKNSKKIENIVVVDRLLFASLKYENRYKKTIFYTPHEPGRDIVHHFQLKNSLPANFLKNFILIGEKKEVSYLKNKHTIKLIDSKLFKFSKTELKIYEVSF